MYLYFASSIKFTGHLLMLPDECGHSLTIRNRTVGHNHIKLQTILSVR